MILDSEASQEHPGVNNVQFRAQGRVPPGRGPIQGASLLWAASVRVSARLSVTGGTTRSGEEEASLSSSPDWAAAGTGSGKGAKGWA